eukprot:9129474-Prorocentrum_lima.AAC.1
MATVNVRSTKIAARREGIERWMIEHNVPIMLLQETRSRPINTERRRKFTWYFSGAPELGNPPAPVFATGVAI